MNPDILQTGNYYKRTHPYRKHTLGALASVEDNSVAINPPVQLHPSHSAADTAT